MIAGSLVFLLGMPLLGAPVVKMLYGPAYGGLRNLIIECSIKEMIQLEQNWLTTLLMANGRTTLFPAITGVRAFAFPAAIIFASIGVSILSIPIGVRPRRDVVARGVLLRGLPPASDRQTATNSVFRSRCDCHCGRRTVGSSVMRRAFLEPHTVRKPEGG
jgi:hypothetical protein